MYNLSLKKKKLKMICIKNTILIVIIDNYIKIKEIKNIYQKTKIK